MPFLLVKNGLHIGQDLLERGVARRVLQDDVGHEVEVLWVQRRQRLMIGRRDVEPLSTCSGVGSAIAETIPRLLSEALIVHL